MWAMGVDWLKFVMKIRHFDGESIQTSNFPHCVIYVIFQSFCMRWHSFAAKMLSNCRIESRRFHATIMGLSLFFVRLFPFFIVIFL